MSTAPSRGPRNTIIQASAGTGKTFQLTNRYLSLLFEGQDPEHILATTFTRKAAGEILERVLLRLAAAATDSKKAAKLAGEIGRKDATQTRCLELFHHLLRRLHRLRIGTLDSFFTQIARSFALELGLPPGWTIVDEMDDARLRLEAIDDVLSGDEPQALATLLHLLAKGESKRGIEQLIEGVVNGLYPLYCEAPREAWFSLQRRKPLDGAELEEAVNQLRAQVLPGSMGKTRDSDIQLIESAEWDELLKKGLTPKVLDGSCVFSRKEIPAEACAIYARVIDHIRALVIDTLAMQTESSHALLERFDEHYRRRKVEQRVRRFDDITRSVSQPASLPGGEGVAFRLDAPVEHLLIDEFQDTSPAQWQALSPMAQHAARGASGSFFCVGDMKQAIYAWRGGVAEIFHAAQSQVPDVSLQSLAKSWRSSRPVIDAVNQVFTQLDKHPNLKHAASAARDWVRVFPFHSTAKI